MAGKPAAATALISRTVQRIVALLMTPQIVTLLNALP
jgi:hypothetical protein